MTLLRIEHYVPVLHARAAEVRAYAELPAPTKDVILPIFVLRPWPNANQLSSVWDQLQDALAGRRFGIDLDRTRRGRVSQKPAQHAFDALFDPASGFQRFYTAVQDQEGAIPVVRQDGSAFPEIAQQFQHISDIGRGGFVRLKRQEPADWSAIIDLLNDDLTTDVAIVADMGWGSDVLLHSAWARSLIEQISAVDPEREIIVCASSFPASFQMIADRGDIPIEERSLFSQIRRDMNANLTYGDWGSTRAPQVDSKPMRNVARIDVPLATIWRSFRSEKFDPDDPDSEREGYQEVCSRAVADSTWPSVPQLWGKYVIEAAAQGLPTGLKSAARAAAARINLHMHMQAHGDTPELIQQTDEPYED